MTSDGRLINEMRISGGIFATSYVVFVGWLAGACLFGFGQFYLLASMIIGVMLLIDVGCTWLAFRVSRNVIRAPPDEIRREDDVILQGMPFISAILFFYINNSIKDDKERIILGLTVVLFTAFIYVSRAIGKIKSNPDFRFWSSVFLVLQSTAILYEVVYFLFAGLQYFITLPFAIQVFVLACLSVIFFLPTATAFAVGIKRYYLTRR